ncbi:glycosyl transferase [Acinetobacter baumannii]|nr:glycosyltransferase [Acinetobacter baumannii]KQD23173.1 glycosyl transferase [Acinetobacter baumannii]
MKILYLITGLGGGGAEKVVADLADQMHLRGHYVKIAYLKGEAIVKPQSADIELICLQLNKVAQFGSALKKFKTVIEQFKPDVVHAHMVHANIFARLARKYVSFPRLICTAHNSNEGGLLRMLAYRYTNNLSDINTNVSKEATESFQKKKAFDSTAITIYNGIDLNKFRKKVVDKNIILSNQVNLNQKIILAVGRLNEQKDYPNLLKAISLLKENSSEDFKLLIAGDGEQKKAIEELISKLNLDNDVILLGRRNDIAELMSIADYFILSSKYEGLPTVIMEAMACETFVISTNCSGVEEIMNDTGIMVPICDSEALAEGLIKAYNLSPKEIELNNLSARRRIEKIFSLEKSIETWLEIYES